MFGKGLLLKYTTLLVFFRMKTNRVVVFSSRLFSNILKYAVVSKVLEKLVNNRIVDHIEICSLFYDFQHSFRSSQSTSDLLTVAYDRIARAFSSSRATRAVALDISKVF